MHGAHGRLVHGPLADQVFEGFGSGPWTLSQWAALLLTWAGGGAINLFARGFLLQYVGDVAAYISAHTVSKFHDVRDAIQATKSVIADRWPTPENGSVVSIGTPVPEKGLRFASSGVNPCSATMHVTRRDSRSCTRSVSAK